MEINEILNTLNPIFRKRLKKDDIQLSEETTAQDIEGWDSLTHMVLINDIEQKFEVRFSFNDIARLKNVGDICITIRSKMN
jgi:acyl carrier protein